MLGVKRNGIKKIREYCAKFIIKIWVPVFLLLLLFWNIKLQVNQDIHSGYLNLLTNINPGLTRREVEKELNAEIGPLIFTNKDMNEVKRGATTEYEWEYFSNYKNVIVPNGGYVLYYSSYCLYRHYGLTGTSAYPINLAIIFNKENRVVTIVFE